MLICGLAICCTYVNIDIAQLLNRPFLFAMQTLKSLYASMKLQVFFLLLCGLATCCTYAVKVDFAHLFEQTIFICMQTITTSFTEIASVFLAKLC